MCGCCHCSGCYQVNICFSTDRGMGGTNTGDTDRGTRRQQRIHNYYGVVLDWLSYSGSEFNLIFIETQLEVEQCELVLRTVFGCSTTFHTNFQMEIKIKTYSNNLSQSLNTITTQSQKQRHFKSDILLKTDWRWEMWDWMISWHREYQQPWCDDLNQCSTSILIW